MLLEKRRAHTPTVNVLVHGFKFMDSWIETLGFKRNIKLSEFASHPVSIKVSKYPSYQIKLNCDARNTCWVSFDGRHQQELLVGDSLRVTTSIYPVPSICAEDQIADWFASLDECLRWNDRKRQKHFDDTEDMSPTDLTSDLTHSSSSDTLDSLSERNEGCDN